MKSIFVLLFFTAVPNAFSETAHMVTLEAQVIPGNTNEPVPQRLQLLGRGIRRHGGQQQMALACYDQACAQVRFVYFNDANVAQWIGDIIQMPYIPADLSERRQAKAKRFAVSEYLLKRKQLRSQLISDEDLTVPGVIIIVVIPTLSKALIPICFFAGLGMIATYEIANLFTLTLEAEAVSQGLAVATHDQNGWNWSEEPRAMGKKRFDRYFQQIKNISIDAKFNHPYFYPNYYDTKEVKLYKKAHKKLKRKEKSLRSRGVIF